jgi:hypothetical protein
MTNSYSYILAPRGSFSGFGGPYCPYWKVIPVIKKVITMLHNLGEILLHAFGKLFPYFAFLTVFLYQPKLQ